jgi:hypothetical protein
MTDWSKFTADAPTATQSVDWSKFEIDKPEAKPKRTLAGTVKDVGITALKGAIGVPEAAVGLADLVSGGHVGKFLENEGGAVGFRPKQAKELLDENYSDAQKAAQAKVSNAQGFMDTAKAAIENPSTIATAIGESLPSMFAGGLVGRGVGAAAKLGKEAAPYLAGLGEGAISAGQGAEQIRQQTDDGLLTGKQAAIAAGSGALTGLIGAGSNKLASEFGVTDADTLLAGGTQGATNKGLARRIGEGAFTEGVLEELPQSTQEQMAQNVALGKDPMQGVGNAAAMGLLTGGVMGGGMGVLHKNAPVPVVTPPPELAAQPQPNAPQPEVAPPPELAAQPQPNAPQPEVAPPTPYPSNIQQDDVTRPVRPNFTMDLAGKEVAPYQQGEVATIPNAPEIKPNSPLNNALASGGISARPQLAQLPQPVVSDEAGFEQPQTPLLNSPLTKASSQVQTPDVIQMPAQDGQIARVDKNGFPIREYTTPEQIQQSRNELAPQFEQPKRVNVGGRVVDTENHNLAQAVNALGGINKQNADEIYGGSVWTDNSNKNNIFRNGDKGRTLGEMHEALVELGYLPQDSEKVTDVIDLLRGKDPKTIYSTNKNNYDDIFKQEEPDEPSLKPQTPETLDDAIAQAGTLEQESNAARTPEDDLRDAFERIKPHLNEDDFYELATDESLSVEQQTKFLNNLANIYENDKSATNPAAQTQGSAAAQTTQISIDDTANDVFSDSNRTDSNGDNPNTQQGIENEFDNSMVQNGDGRTDTARTESTTTPSETGQVSLESPNQEAQAQTLNEQRNSIADVSATAASTEESSRPAESSDANKTMDGGNQKLSVPEKSGLETEAQQTVSQFSQSDGQNTTSTPKPILTTGGVPVRSFVAARQSLKKQGLFDSHEIIKQTDGSFFDIPKSESSVQAANNENLMPSADDQEISDAQDYIKSLPQKMQDFLAGSKEKALQSLKQAQASGDKARLKDEMKSYKMAYGETPDLTVKSPDEIRQNYLDSDFEHLPLAKNVGVGEGDKRVIKLPKTKGKPERYANIENDYVLSMDNGKFVDLPPMTRKKALELSKTKEDKAGEKVNEFYDVVPRAYAEHMGYKPTPDTLGLINDTDVNERSALYSDDKTTPVKEQDGRSDSLQIDDIAKVEKNKDPDTGEVYYLISHPLRRSGVDTDRKSLETLSPRFAGLRKRFDTPETAKEWGIKNGYQFDKPVTQGDVSNTQSNQSEKTGSSYADIFKSYEEAESGFISSHTEKKAHESVIRNLKGSDASARDALRQILETGTTDNEKILNSPIGKRFIDFLESKRQSEKDTNENGIPIKNVSEEEKQANYEKRISDIADSLEVQHSFKDNDGDNYQVYDPEHDIFYGHFHIDKNGKLNNVRAGENINDFDFSAFKKKVDEFVGDKPKTTDIYNRSNRSNEPDNEQKSALVAKGGVTGTVIQSEKQRLDLTTFSENADVKALGFDAQKLKKAEHLIEKIGEMALNRKQEEFNEHELVKDLENLAKDPKSGITVELLDNGATRYKMTVGDKKLSFTRSPNGENYNSDEREKIDQIKRKLVEIGAGEWNVKELVLAVQPFDKDVAGMRERARNNADKARTAEEKMQAAAEAKKSQNFFNDVFKKLKDVFYSLFKSIVSNPDKAKEIDDTKRYMWRNSDNTAFFEVKKGSGTFVPFDDNTNIKGETPAEKKRNIELKNQLNDEMKSIQATAFKRGLISARAVGSNTKEEINNEVEIQLSAYPELLQLFEPLKAAPFDRTNFKGFTAAKGDDYTPPSKQSEPAPNNPQQPVEKSPENKQVDDDVSKNDKKIDNNVTTQNADATGVTEEKEPVSSPAKSEQVKAAIENATPETKALKENGNLIVGTVGFEDKNKPTKGNDNADTTRASVSDGDVSTATNEPRVPAKEPRLPNSGGTRKSRAGLQAGQGELIEANHVASWATELPTDERVVGHETDAENQRPVGREDGSDGSVSKPVGAHNFSLIDKPAISLTPAKRRDVNALAEKILEKPIDEVTEADKEILRQYTGVGGLNTKDQVDKGAGIFNQHYTHYDTIKAIYGALEKAGVKMDYILEPSVGSGNFIGMHPNAEWVAVDIDKTNTEIVKRLYQDATVHHQSYEDFNGKDFDLIISNVPFASFADLPREKHTTVLPAFKAIHNFFFAHSVDKLKDGGVMAFMTSTGTMDGTKEAAKLRASLIKKADVIGAYRLPMGTQKENASTDVMIDLIFLQKRPEGVESNQPEKNQSFVETTSKDGHKINKYFVDYPESVLGDLSVDTIQTAMGSREGLVVKGEPRYENIKVDYQDYKTSKKSDVSNGQFANMYEAQEYAKKNGLEFIHDWKTPYFENGILYDAPFKYSRSDASGIFGRKLTGVFADKMAALQAIDANPTAEAVDAYKEKYELSPHNDKKLQLWAKKNLAEKQLKSYQALFDKDFNLSERFTKQVRFENSGKIEVTKDSPLLDRAESLEDADGYIIINKADGLISDSEIQTLLDNGKYARVGANSIQNARLYYAGNIYHKIAALDKVNPIEQREKQAKLLEKVKPAPIPLSRISITGREEWLPPEARAAIGISNNADGSLAISSDTISDDFMRAIMNNYLNHEKLVESKRDETPEEYASRTKEAQNLLANEILPIIKQKITDDGLEKTVVESYNRAMNFFAAPVFDGSSLKNLPQTFKGKPFKLMQHQQEGAERAIYNKKGVLAFSPGLGKTPTAIIVAHQLLQKGVVKKPLFIVPANTIHQWESSTKSLYPDAKVFEYPKYKSGKNAGQAKEWQALTAEDKERMVNDLANNQYDYTYISTNLAQKFTVPEAKMSEYVDRLAEQISTMEKPDDELNKKQIKAKQQRLAKLAALRHSMMSAFAEDASSGFDMERLGFDAIFADEVQYYKNIGMQSEDAKGGIGASVTLNAKFPVTVDSNGKEVQDKEASPLSVTIGSARSYDFRFKTMYISEKNNGNNIFLLTGTPTPNKPLELLTLLHHMDVNTLNEYGIENVGDFVDSFFDLSEVEKEGIDGTVKMETQLTGMKNVDAMKKIITRYVDYRSPESASDLTRPKQIDVNHAILMSDEAQIVFADIQGRVMQAMDDAKAKMQGGHVEDAEAIIAMYTAGRDASIDVRLYKPTVKSTLATVGQTFEEETRADYSKIAKTVQLVAEQLKNKSDSGQLIFLDRLSFPDGGSTHEDIRNKVIAATGLSEKEVVFVNGSQHVNPATGKVVKSNPDLKRLQEIMDAYNANEIKVLIGNTSKLGVGVDLNVHTTDIYQVDKLYRPDEIEQRNNRGVRQGNKNAEVRVHTFNQIGTFDALSDRIIANKQGFNDVFWKDQDSDTVDVKAEEVPSAYDAAIELEKDPYKKRKLEIERDLEHSRSKERGLEKQVSNLAGRIRTTEKNINDYVTANNGIDNRPAPEYKDKSPAEREQAIAEFKDRMAEQKAKNTAKITTLQASLDNLKSEKEARQAELVAHRASESEMRSKYVVEGVVSIDAIKRNDDIKPSKTQSSTNTYTKESLESALKNAADSAFGKGWFNRLIATGKFKIIDSNEVKAFTSETGVQAFYHNGTTYFVADGIAAKTDLIGLLKHEIGIHALKMGKDDAGFQAILKQIEAMRGKNAAIDKAFAAAERAGTSKADLLEEVAGYLVEQAPELKLTQRLLAWFRNEIRKLTGDMFANNLTVNDLNYMAREALRKAPDELILDAVEPMEIMLGKAQSTPDPKGIKEKLIADAAPIRHIPATREAWNKDFPEGFANTPIGKVKLGENQFDKLVTNDRGRFAGLVKPTLESPTYVIKDSKDGTIFMKVFTKEDGKLRGFASISYSIDGINIVVSNHPKDMSFLVREANGGEVLWTEGMVRLHKAVDTLATDSTKSSEFQSPLASGLDENIPQTPDDSIKFSKTQPEESQFADDYELNRQNVKSKKQHLKDMSARFGKEAAHGIGNFLGSARTRLENISPKLGAKYIQLEHDIAANEAKAVKAVKPFMDKTKTMSKSDVIDFDFAAKNNDSAKIDELVSKYNMQAEYQAMLDALEKVNENAKEVGMAVNDGIPKVLRDTNGFLDAIGEGVFTKRLKEYAADMGLSYDELTLEQKADIVNGMIKTGSRSIKKDIGSVTPELNQYFMGTNAAILSHIHEMTKHAQYRKFLGGISQRVRTTQKELEAIKTDIAKQENLMTNAKTDDAKESARQKRDELKGVEGQLNAILLKYALQNDYHENVASYIMKAIADGEIKPSDERIVQEVLNARLHEKGATGVTAAYKNLSLIDTMGSPISAITQLGDFTWAMYESGGLFGGLKAIGNAIRGKAVFDRTDYGLERIAQEFTESDTFAGAVDKVFGLVGIKYTTGVASDSLLNAISDKLTRQAQANDSRLMDKLKTYFDDDANQVLEDLKNGVINDNTRLMIYSRYLDFAPVTLSELPIKYQTAGNGRLFYTLKSYTLKLFDVYRREAVQEIFSGDKQRAIQGMKNLMMILALLMLTGGGADELKDYLLGRNTDFNDRVTDNLWKLAGLSKFITWQVRREGVGTAAIKQILPPFAFVNAVGNDIIHANDINRHPKNEMWVNGLDTTSSIPVVGKLVYWNFGRGTQKHKELSEIRFTKEKQKLNDVKDEFEQLEGDEKKQFYIEHKAEFARLKQAGHIQATANRLKGIINKQRAMPKTDEREAVITRLEKQRDAVISQFVGMN